MGIILSDHGGMFMLSFILGSMLGGTVGVFAMCLCTAASRSDSEE